MTYDFVSAANELHYTFGTMLYAHLGALREGVSPSGLQYGFRYEGNVYALYLSERDGAYQVEVFRNQEPSRVLRGLAENQVLEAVKSLL